ncbi:MAG: hypothetical protein WD688_22645 [Candidatus Binatia bacterium]
MTTALTASKLINTSSRNMDLQQLAKVNAFAVHSAGPRYTPGIDSAAPNLQIEHLNLALDGLLCNDRFKKTIGDFHDSLKKAWADAQRHIHKPYRRKIPRATRLLNLLIKFKKSPIGAGRSVVSASRATVGRINSAIRSLSEAFYEEQNKRRNELREEQKDEDSLDAKLRSLEAQHHYLRRYESSLSAVAEFLDSAGCLLQFTNRALLLGAWGTGKTHFLCDVAEQHVKNGMPSVIVLAKDFDPGPDLGSGLAKFTGLAPNLRQLLENLNAMGELSRQRALLMIDGINEADQDSWRRGIIVLRKAVRQFPHVGLILSCREPFETVVFKDGDRKQFATLSHGGFSDIEFDAQTEFFKYYGIPLPHIPLLADEFSRPLTLKIICEAFKDLPKKAQRKGFSGIISGQRGMTFILERFVNRRATEIEGNMKLPRQFCWNLIKGDDGISDPLTSGFAPYMARKLTENVETEECLRIIQVRALTKKRSIAKKLYQRLVAEGLLLEGVRWRDQKDGGPVKVVQLPYQRFSDHIIARHLLKRDLVTTSETAIRRSFYVRTKLGKLFVFDRHFPRFLMQGWVEAIISEFPERVRNTLPESQRELFYYLPKSRRSLSAYFEPFTGSLYWRSGSSISTDTGKIAGIYFWQKSTYTASPMIEALSAAATKPEHPYNGACLYRNLERIEMSERDLHWGEFIRHRAAGNTIERIVRWFESHPVDTLSEVEAINYIIILSLFLTTTDRMLRDRATRVLVLLGERFPDQLFSHTLTSLKFNDPYVRERMLAASYGVTMSMWADKDAHEFQQALPPFARSLVQAMFIPNGRARTQHTVIRDYALGIIELARKVNPRCISLSLIKYLKRPYSAIPDPFPPANQISESECENANGAIHMDFGNYTIGHLIKDRQNYDMKNPSYLDVRRKIEWRIGNLGYRNSTFGSVDQAITSDREWRAHRDQGQIDRYGKKYSWIAYFEMYGLLQARGQLFDEYRGDRSSDSDIDPSFPKRPPNWLPAISRISMRVPADDEAWLREGAIPNYNHLLRLDKINNTPGPWVLLDGYIHEQDIATLRTMLTFLRGFFIKEDLIPLLQSRLAEVDHPGSGLPDSGDDVYTFCGEIPWSTQFGRAIRTRRGNLRVVKDFAFARSVAVKKRRRIKKAWQFVYQIVGTTAIPRSYPIIVRMPDENPTDKGNSVGFEQLAEAIKKGNGFVPLRERINVADLYFQIPPTREEVTRGFRYEDVWNRDPGIPVETTSWRYGWEGYHSSLNDFRGFYVPSPQLCESSELIAKHRDVDLLDRNGVHASVYRELKDNDNLTGHLLYYRKDLFEKYLKLTGKLFAWIVWGERGFHYNRAERMIGDKKFSEIFQSHAHVHKALFRY